jgi:hypothetical protein
LEGFISQAKDASLKISRDIPKIDPEVAEAALKGFMPFATAPLKQANYKTYLEFMSNKAGVSVVRFCFSIYSLNLLTSNQFRITYQMLI